MKTFLDEFADQLLQNHNTSLHDICVVMPNRRAGLFLKKSLSRAAGKTIWSPDIYSIEDFLTKISGFKKPDRATLTFELYEIHRQIEKEHARDFEQFAKWGQVMLADFNEIDMHLIDAKVLYGYLSEVKALEKWNPDGRPLTKAEREYLAFYRSIFDYYTRLRKKLTDKKSGYQGMIYRYASENIEKLSRASNWEKIYFAGFNALTRAEEKVISHLRENKNAVVLRDADAYYMDDPSQEAGDFLRKQKQKEGSEKFGPVRTFYRDQEKEIEIHGIPRKEGQAQKAGQILYNLIRKNNNRNDNIAIVLADESLLLPVLNALPENVGQFNITMGYPLQHTPPYSFIMLLLRMYENAARFKNMADKQDRGFYFRDILRVLRHSMISGIGDTARHTATINATQQVFYQPEEIQQILKGSDLQEPASVIFEKATPEPGQILETISRVIEIFRKRYQDGLKKNSPKPEAALQLEYLYHTSSVIKRLKELNQQYQTLISVRTLRDLFRQISQTARLPFTGEPLTGIQILGMLETRNLDFSKVILISANEGILPANAIGNSLLPYDVQVEMKMPTHNQKNAVFAYHFYRMIQRASEVHLIYNTEPDELGGGEQSRFIQQLKNELPVYNPRTKITETVESLPPPDKPADSTIEIPKNEPVLNSLMNRAAKGLSPTSLNQYRRCALQFYFKNVGGLHEIDEVEENLDFKTIGSVVHQVLEDLFQPFVEKVITADHVRAMKPQTAELIKTAIDKYYKKGQVQFGKNRLIYEVIRNYLNAYLNFESETLSKEKPTLKILALEEKVKSENLAQHFPGLEDQDIRLKGIIDRLDRYNDIIRIIDYKTGKVERPSELHIESFEDFEDGTKNEKAFQVMLYAWLYNRTRQVITDKTTTGVISLPVLSKGLMNFGMKESRNARPDEMVDEEKLEGFEQYLMHLLSEIFDRDEPFRQTEETTTCRTCDFKDICNR